MGLIAALGFLTVLPGPRRLDQPAEFGRAVGYFPLVGALIGGLLVGLDALLAPLFPLSVRSALLIGAALVLTRGLHLDGLMDSCDGLFGGFTPERRLAIMRDSAVGAFGVLGGVVALLLRYATLTALSGPWRVAGLLLAPTLGRWAMAYALVAFPYARAEGLGRAFKEAAGRRDLALATLFALVAGAAIWWPWGALLVLPAWVLAWLGARFILRRVPGLTGDSYGALNEVVELACLLFLVARQP